LLNQLLNRKV